MIHTNVFRMIGVYWRTIRHLKISQINYRILYTFYTPKISAKGLSALKRRSMSLKVFLSRNQSLIGPAKWTFLNQTHSLSELGWTGQTCSKLWRYNQHYFDDLNAINAAQRIDWHHQIIQSWISQNSAGEGDGWEPYPTSLRIVNWIKWMVKFGIVRQSYDASLALQTRWLIQNIEYHLLGNHLIANAKALIFSGIYFQGDEADRWLRKGLKILIKEYEEQILTDGGHFELSPMYHAIILEDLLDIINVISENKECCPDIETMQLDYWKKLVPLMLRWLSSVTHPDGRIAFFNDSAFNISADFSDLLEYANRLGILYENKKFGVTDNMASGMIRFENPSATLIADCAPVGPTYQPGHGHADTLSFEFSLGKTRIFVNSGISTYNTGELRNWQRSTAAHNTVTLNGENSSEVWSAFRVGWRAQITEKRVFSDQQSMHLFGKHNGYKRLNKNISHLRHFILTSNYLEINDEITYQLNAEARFYLHPSAKIYKKSAVTGTILLDGNELCEWEIAGVKDVNIERSKWYPEFGSSEDNQLLVARIDGEKSCFRVTW